MTAKVKEKIHCYKCNKIIEGNAKYKGYNRDTHNNDFEHDICPNDKNNENFKEKKEKNQMNEIKKTTKKITKKTRRKKIKVKKTEKKAEKTVKKTEKEKTKEKKQTISSIVYDGINKKLSYEDIEKEVKKIRPDSKFNKTHYNWYKAQSKLK